MRNYVTALSLAFTIALPLAAQAQDVTPPPVPANIVVPEGNHAYFVGHGVGFQNYVCSPSKSVGQVEWTLFTPEAHLFGDAGEQLTSHFFSPNPDEGNTAIRATWRDSQDSSTVWAKANAASSDPAFVNPGAVAWVLLQVVGKQVGPTGGANLTRTTFIQRLSTVGGLAPATGCDVPTDLGAKAFMPYTADYFFFTKN
jgi:Protein of unknown function (DUF3455)